MLSKIISTLLSIVTVCIIAITAVAVIAYGRGYRFDFGKKALNSTGLVVIQSDPSGAQITVDGKVKSATAATLTLPPGSYTIAISKEGFQAWEKRVKVQGEVVNKIEALLIPTNPSLTALTVSGVLAPTLSPDGSKVAYVVPEAAQGAIAGVVSATRPGIWVLDLVDKPLGLNRDARQIAQSLPAGGQVTGVDFAKAALSWSPDSKEILVTTATGTSYLLDTDKLNAILPPVAIKTVQTEWQTAKEQRRKEQLATIPVLFTDVASQSASIIALSPDETKILYEATAAATIPPIITPPLIGTNPTEETRAIKPHNVYVYDVKEDRNYLVLPAASLSMPATPTPGKVLRQAPPAETTDVASVLRWLPTSRHLVFVVKDKIQITDYDGTNRRTAYAGPFWDSFAVPWASGGKLVILTNLNPSAAINNLYVVNLK